MRPIILAALLLTAAPCVAADKITDPNEKQAVADCTSDALRYCAAAIPKGRDAIIACMLVNRAKLRERCSKHFWVN